jgi:hypothetical protein
MRPFSFHNIYIEVPIIRTGTRHKIYSGGYYFNGVVHIYSFTLDCLEQRSFKALKRTKVLTRFSRIVFYKQKCVNNVRYLFSASKLDGNAEIQRKNVITYHK